MSYAPIVLPADLKTHIYPEIIDEITRNDSTIITTAIDSAIAQVKMYLARYDKIAMFGDQATDVSATFTPDSFLLNIIKAIAVWQIISGLSNPGINYERYKIKYDDAIYALRDIQKGVGDAEWPYKDFTGVTTTPSIEVTVHSNEKPNNYF